MAAILQRPNHSLDYFSLGQERPEPSRVNSTSSHVWAQIPYSDPALQSPTSEESLAVSPVSPHTRSYSRAGYALPLEPAGIDGKSYPTPAYGSSFEDWMGWEESAGNTVYPTLRQNMNTRADPVSPIMGTLELAGGLNTHPNPAGLSVMDDSVAFQDTMAEEPLFPTQPDMQTPSTNGLFPTSLAWTQPQQMYRASPHVSTYSQLNVADATKLISIPMPPSPIPESPEMPRPVSSRRKRKSSSSSTSTNASSASSNPPPRRQAPVKKTAHNMIEKRYRTNLNDKIAALRDSVPSLRMNDQKAQGVEVVQDDTQGVDLPHKLNKATILSKATEYIAHLEGRNVHLTKECQSLKNRVEAFERLLMSRSPNGSNGNGQGGGQKPRWKQMSNGQQVHK